MLNKNNAYGKAMLYSTNSTQDARMVISDYKGYPRLSVFVATKGSKGKSWSKVNFAINKIGLYFIVDELSSIMSKKEDYSVGIDMFSPVWENDKQTDDIKKAGRLTLGRKKIDNKFINYFTVESNNDVRYSFKILPSPYVKITRNGTLLQGEDLSIAWTRSYRLMLKGILDLSLEAREGETSIAEATKSKIINSNVNKELEKI